MLEPIRQTYGEHVDRWTILMLRAQVDKTYKPDCRRYGDVVRSWFREAPEKGADIIAETVQLMSINKEIWACEADIRREYDNDPMRQFRDELPLEEIGRRAVRIRELNNKRKELVNHISKAMTGSIQ